MNSLLALHRRLIESSGSSARPITPKQPRVPILPSERWLEAGGALCKVFRFRRMDDRNDFVIQLLAYEAAQHHGATLSVDGDTVGLKVQTKDIDVVSELDRELARYADILYRGLVYHPADGDEAQSEG
jgi:pterin-4a-carbinolamine dehydratase